MDVAFRTTDAGLYFKLSINLLTFTTQKTLEMLNFYPGPSKIYPQTKAWMSEIYDSGILAMNHRSAAFMELWQETEVLLKAKLTIPESYEVYVTSSATECWEIVNQSLLSGNVHYLYNGAFGEKWWDYGKKIIAYTKAKSLILNGLYFSETNSVTEILPEETDTVCLTHNETSNGTALTHENLKFIRSTYKNAVIAVDATSSMAGVVLPWETADVWFASVQKCFGLPSGLAVMIVSTKAIQRAEEVNETAHYNSFLSIRANFQKNQTPYTPNILGIALLHKSMNFRENISGISEKISQRAADFYKFIERETEFDLLVNEVSVRSKTVIAIKTNYPEKIISHLAEKNITVGKGYGEWKANTFRIANFPAIEDEEFEILKKALQNF